MQVAVHAGLLGRVPCFTTYMVRGTYPNQPMLAQNGSMTFHIQIHRTYSNIRPISCYIVSTEEKPRQALDRDAEYVPIPKLVADAYCFCKSKSRRASLNYRKNILRPGSPKIRAAEPIGNGVGPCLQSRCAKHMLCTVRINPNSWVFRSLPQPQNIAIAGQVGKSVCSQGVAIPSFLRSSFFSLLRHSMFLYMISAIRRSR